MAPLRLYMRNSAITRALWQLCGIDGDASIHRPRPWPVPTPSQPDCGYFVDELDNRLHVGTKDALRKLVRDARVTREKVAGQFLYCAVNSRLRRQQLLARRSRLAEPGVVGPIPEAAILPDELRAAIVLFFSLLDEKQRRLYAGLEALKTGRGGDGRIAEFLGLDTGTGTRGRQELIEQDVEVERARRAGGGRKLVEKKRPKSSRTSKS